jgi:ribose 5-phosphate isomerase B
MSAKIYLGADHAGFEMKEAIKEFLLSKNYQVEDLGTHSADSVDYPDFAHGVASKVEEQEERVGFLFCGSANGVCITANKHKGIRAGLAWNTEIAELTRQHNNANILCIPARYVSIDLAENMVKRFLSTSFEGGRHQLRVNKI